MNMDERVMLETLLRETPGSSAAVLRKGLLEEDVDVSLHARVGAAIEDTVLGETVIAAAVLPIVYPKVVRTLRTRRSGGSPAGRRWRPQAAEDRRQDVSGRRRGRPARSQLHLGEGSVPGVGAGGACPDAQGDLRVRLRGRCRIVSMHGGEGHGGEGMAGGLPAGSRRSTTIVRGCVARACGAGSSAPRSQRRLLGRVGYRCARSSASSSSTRASARARA